MIRGDFFAAKAKERREIFARGSQPDEVSEEVGTIVLGDVLPRLFQDLDPDALSENLIHFIEVLNEDVPADVDVSDLLQFANFALEQFLAPAPPEITGLVMKAVYLLQLRERELSHILCDPAIVAFFASQLLIQTNPVMLLSILNVCTQLLFSDFELVATSIVPPVLRLLSLADPVLVSASLQFFRTMFDSPFSGKAALSQEIVRRLAPVIESSPDLRIIQSISSLFEAFLSSHIIVPLLPGGVGCYNALLKSDDPAVLYRSLSTLVVLLSQPGPHIQVLRESLDWPQLLCILMNSHFQCVTHALTCFANLASYGEAECRFLQDMGFLDAIMRLLEESVFAVKVPAFECLYPFLALPDIAVWAIYDTPLLTSAAELIAVAALHSLISEALSAVL
jgi:hypothetical protein